MKLFISYSRGDKAWVFELWRALRDRGRHDAWIDSHVKPGQDWWTTILQTIKDCECFIYILTPKSATSIYCQAEMGYAVALNKPIIPLMLTPCEYPADLNSRRTQYQEITDEMRIGDVLYLISEALGEIRVDTLQGVYALREAIPPPEPKAAKKPEQVSEVYLLAEESVERDFARAEQLFQQVIAIDPQGWGLAAAERLAEIRFERQRAAEYVSIVQMVNNPALIRGARAAAPMFIGKYPHYDPNGILPGLLVPEAPPIPVQSDPAPVRIEVPVPVSVKSDPVLAAGARMTDPKGITMVYVPAGKFLMGSTPQQVDEAFAQAKKEYKDAKKEWYTDQIPEHEQIIQAGFWLDLTPVTNAIYARFVAEDGYRTREFWTERGWKWVQDQKKAGPSDYPQHSSAPDEPRVGVTWYEAWAYCQWRGGRLPTEAEWEWAARGPENRIYPWSNTFDPDRVVYRQNSDLKTAPVGAGIRSAGASWVGALDLAGNVWEWVSSLYRPYPYQVDDGRESNNDSNSRVLRGGSFSYLVYNLRSAHRYGLAPDFEYLGSGFRYARS